MAEFKDAVKQLLNTSGGPRSVSAMRACLRQYYPHLVLPRRNADLIRMLRHADFVVTVGRVSGAPAMVVSE